MVFIIILIILVVIYVVIKTKFNNLRHRATQEVLKDTKFSSSAINANITEKVEKKQLQKFLEEHTEFTEETAKDFFKNCSDNLIAKNPINEFSDEVKQKMQNDSKLEKMIGMEFVRANINYYGNTRLNVIAFYTDKRDEYNIYLGFKVIDNQIELNKYQIVKGMTVGF